MKVANVSRRTYGGKSAEQRRVERRARLVESALEIWQDQGWAAVTMRGVCARAGLSDRYFYESFADRDELLGTVWDQMRDETMTMVMEAISNAADQSALEQLRAALDATVHHIADEPNRAQIIFGDHAGSAVLEQRRRDTVQMSTDLLISLARPFLLDDVDERALRVNVLLGIGGFVELMLAWRDGLIAMSPEQIVEQLADVGAALGRRFLAAEP